MEVMMKVNAPRETRGMRKEWMEGVHGLMTVLRVLPEPYYSQVMHRNDNIGPGEIFDAIAKSTLAF